MRFNFDGTLLATAGQDGAVAVWRALDGAGGEFLAGVPVGGNNNNSSQSGNSGGGGGGDGDGIGGIGGNGGNGTTDGVGEDASGGGGSGGGGAGSSSPCVPFCRLSGHTKDVLDLSWSCSRSNLLLSASMDGTVRLWRVNMAEKEPNLVSGGAFRHADIVTSVVFHPHNEACFLTACLDNRIRMWTADDSGQCVREAAVSGFVTVLSFAHTQSFSPPINNNSSDPSASASSSAGSSSSSSSSTNDASLICGTYDGRCVWYSVSDGETEASSRLEEVPGGCISVGARGGRDGLRSGGQSNSKQTSAARRRKITGIELLTPSPPSEKEFMLVTTSDSRARLVDLTTLQCLRTFGGLVNAHFQIGASFSETGKLLLCGSEDGNLLLWDASIPSAAKHTEKHEKVPVLDKLCASRTTVSCAEFAPFARRANPLRRREGQILVSADAHGEIKVWENYETRI
jgi:WD repeat-containing protein 44